MIRSTFYTFLAGLLFFMPLVVSAAEPFEIVISRIGKWVGLLTPVLVALGLVVFFWGLVRFIWHGGDEEKRKEGKKLMGWGIVALFVMVSIWGIVVFIQDSIFSGTGINPSGGSFETPCLEGIPGFDCETREAPPPSGGPPPSEEPCQPYPECVKELL